MSTMAGTHDLIGEAACGDGAATAGLVALRSGPGAALIAATVLATLVSIVDANVVNVAAPAIGRELRASVTTLQWTLTSYLVTVASLLLLSGALADRFDGSRPLVRIPASPSMERDD
jgi:MFS family permease